MKTSSKLFSAFLLGAATGALLSPDKGSELRKKISRNASDLLDQLQDTISDGKETFAGLKEKIIARANEIKDDVSEVRNSRDKQKRKETRMKRKTDLADKILRNGNGRSK